MKLCRALLLAFVCVVLPAYAQDYEQKIHQAELIKSSKGEDNEQYLTALSEIIKSAASLQNYEDANKYRLEHMSVIERMKGSESYEYAEDLWRLGNVSGFKGEDYVFSCYSKSEKILASVDTCSYVYLDLMWMHSVHYYNLNDWKSALSYITRTIRLAENWLGREWHGLSIDKVTFANFYAIQGDLYALLEKYEKSVDSYIHCCEILEKNQIVDEYPYYARTMKRIASVYEISSDIGNKLAWDLKYRDYIASTLGEFSGEYNDAVRDVGNDYYLLKDYDNAIASGKKRIELTKMVLEAENKIPDEDTLYIYSVADLYDMYLDLKMYSNVIETGSILKGSLEKLKLTDTYDYIKVLADLLDASYEIDEYQWFVSTGLIFESIIKQQSLENTSEYWAYLFHKLNVSMSLFDNETYERILEELTPITIELYGEYSKRYLDLLLCVADRYFITGKTDNAKSVLATANRVLEALDFSFISTYDSVSVCSQIHHLEGSILADVGNPDAEEKLLLAIYEYESINNDTDIDGYNNLGVYYVKNNQYNKALECFNKVERVLEAKGALSDRYYTVLNNIGLCYQGLGKITLGVRAFEKALLFAESFSVQHPIYANAVTNMAIFYAGISDYTSAVMYSEKAKDVTENIYGGDSEEYARTLVNLGVVYSQINQYDKAAQYSLDAIGILGNSPNVGCVDLITAYNCLIGAYGHTGKYDKMVETGTKCLDLLTDNGLDESLLAVSCLSAVGWSLADCNKIQESKQCFDAILSQLNKLSLQNTPRYIDALLFYCLLCYTDGYPNSDYIITLSDLYYNQYLTDYVFLNHTERETLVLGSKFTRLKNIIFSSQVSDTRNECLYDFLLFSKGLLLETSKLFTKAVYDSGDESIIDDYKRLLEITKTMTEGNNTYRSMKSVESSELQKQASALEREITGKLQNSNEYISSLSLKYTDVIQSLKRNEIAVEFVLYEDLKGSTGVEKYAALIAKKGWETPKFVLLGNKSDVDKLVTNTPAKLYSEGFVSSELYSLLWAPLEDIIPGGATVYFSPDGCIYQLAIEQLVDKNGKRICDKFDMRRCSSTKTICHRRTETSYSNATLYGGLTYDEDDNDMLLASRKYSVTTDNSNGIFVSDSTDNTRSGWKFLPGTLSEVTTISNLLTDAGVNCVLYSDADGNEESFKALSGTDISILHLATHGFYLDSSNKEKSSFAFFNPYAQAPISDVISSMDRSGLLMSGGNRAWLGNLPPEGVEDGVLTANEISNLDLKTVDLLVLSACETGLGKISNEGVWGLQRAFKGAGVGTIIMSLWDVDDEATSIMMQTFYQNLFDGKSKRDAFVIAQQKVREKFEDPTYWAAFVMLD